MNRKMVLKPYSPEEILELKEIIRMKPYSAEKRARVNEFCTKTGRSTGAVDNKINKITIGGDKVDNATTTTSKTVSKIAATKTTRKYTKKTPVVATLRAATATKSEIRIPYKNVRVEANELIFSF